MLIRFLSTHSSLGKQNREPGARPRVSDGHGARRGRRSLYRREDEAADQEVGLGCADPDLEREMLSQRLGVERLAGLRIGHQAANMLLREAQPGQGFDDMALLGIRHKSFSPTAAGHSRHEILRYLKLSLRVPLFAILTFYTILLLNCQYAGRTVTLRC
jgi:hypothetical protein